VQDLETSPALRDLFSDLVRPEQFAELYGKKAAALYTQAGDYQKTARFYYKKAEDTYYQVLFEATLRTVTMQSARCSRARLACTQNCCCASGPAGLRCVAGAVPRAIVVFACNGHSRRVFSLLTPSATVRPTTGPRTTTGAAPATSGTTSTRVCPHTALRGSCGAKCRCAILHLCIPHPIASGLLVCIQFNHQGG
jgi:hypothetical protein